MYSLYSNPLNIRLTLPEIVILFCVASSLIAYLQFHYEYLVTFPVYCTQLNDSTAAENVSVEKEDSKREVESRPILRRVQPQRSGFLNVQRRVSWADERTEPRTAGSIADRLIGPNKELEPGQFRWLREHDGSFRLFYYPYGGELQWTKLPAVDNMDLPAFSSSLICSLLLVYSCICVKLGPTFKRTSASAWTSIHLNMGIEYSIMSSEMLASVHTRCPAEPREQ